MTVNSSLSAFQRRRCRNSCATSTKLPRPCTRKTMTSTARAASSFTRLRSRATGVRRATAQILQQIIQETTNRMNRLQQQESENEWQLLQIKGDIEEERAKTELLSVQVE